LTKTMMVIVAGCVALVVTAMVSIIEREVVPPAPSTTKQDQAAGPVGPSSNSDGKRDRLPVEGLRLEPPAPTPENPLRQAYAPDGSVAEPGEPIAGPIPLPRARTAPRAVIQKNYTLLSDMQIAAVKSRLQLTRAQEALWPDVERALRTLARNMHDRRLASPGASAELDGAEIEQLKIAAQPLIAKLNEEQKREVRALARLIGLDAVASSM
jgi:hypothetical protein